MTYRITFIFAVALATTPAWAHHFRSTANLSGGYETPPNVSPAVGHAVITLDLDLHTMRVRNYV